MAVLVPYARQGLRQEDIPVACGAQDVAQAAQLLLEAIARMRFEMALEQDQQRAQAPDADAHLMDAFLLVAAQRRRLVDHQMVEHLLSQSPEGVGQAKTRLELDRRRLAGVGPCAVQEMIAPLGLAFARQ